MEFVVRQQFHAFRKVLLQNLQIEVRSAVLGGGDIVQGFLEREPVAGLGPVGKQFREHFIGAILAGGSLQIAVRV